jgi:hypothetical protein
MWTRAVRVFVVASMLLNGMLALALMGATAFGRRPITPVNILILAALLFGFFNAVGDLIEAERPVAAEAHPPLLDV